MRDGGGLRKKQLPPPWYGRDMQTLGSPFWKEGDSLAPLCSSVSCLPSAQLFLKAVSVHIGKLQMAYSGNVNCPHRKYTHH